MSGTVECRRTGLVMVYVNRAERVGECNDEDWCAVDAGPCLCVYVSVWSDIPGGWTNGLVGEYSGTALSGRANRTVEWSGLGDCVGRSSPAGWRVDQSV